MTRESSKVRAVPHIPSIVLTALLADAARVGVTLDCVVIAAIQMFCDQDVETRRLIVSHFWLTGLQQIETSEARRPRAFKERVHALVAHAYAAFRHRPTQ
jgi:hypothetical protein